MTPAADIHEVPRPFDMREAAREYLAAGYPIVPLPPRSKVPYTKDWPTTTFDGDDVQPDSNLGNKCEKDTDIDIDCRLALRCADHFLLLTPRIHGRPGKPRSHRWYEGQLETEKFKDIDQAYDAQVMLVEIRSGSNNQTVVPPSLWVNKDDPTVRERLAWIDGSVTGPPAAVVDLPYLRAQVVSIATVALIARHWPAEGIRRELRLAYARVLLETLKLDVPTASDILEWACRLGGSDDDGVKHAARAVRDTRDALDRDEKTTGGATVAKLLPEGGALLERLREWYGVQAGIGQLVLDEFADYFITQLGSRDGLLKTMVGCDREFPPSFQTYSAFTQYYSDTLIRVGTGDKVKTTTRAKLWLSAKQHRKYEDVQFLPPPCTVPPGILNLWNGFAVQPDPNPYPERRCPLFLEHIRSVVCGGEHPDVAEFHLDVLAAKVQRPAYLTEVALVYRGPQGVGKNAGTVYLESLFGRHLATIAKHQLATGRFNAVLSSKLVIVLDEAMWPGHREFIGALKSLVTDPKLAVERKGIDVVFETNFVQVIVLTNGDWAWPTELSDRRALILDVLPTHMGDIAYFKALHYERTNGGAEALLAYLQQRVITHELRLVPHTQARNKQIEITDDDAVRSMWFAMLHQGTTWPEGERWEAFISTNDLEEYYAERCKATRQRPLPQRVFLKEWRALLPPGFKANEQQRIIDRDVVLAARKRGGWHRDKDGVEYPPEPVNRRGTRVPVLNVCREHYAKQVEKGDIDWPPPPAPEEPEKPPF